MENYRVARLKDKKVLARRKPGAFAFEVIESCVDGRFYGSDFIVLEQENNKNKIYAINHQDQSLELITEEADSFGDRYLSVDDNPQASALVFNVGFDWFIKLIGQTELISLGELDDILYLRPLENGAGVCVSYYTYNLHQENYVSVKTFGEGKYKKWLCLRADGFYRLLRQDTCALGYRSIEKVNQEIVTLTDDDSRVHKLFYSYENEGYVQWFKGIDISLHLDNAVLYTEDNRLVLLAHNGKSAIRLFAASKDNVELRPGLIVLGERYWTYSDNVLNLEAKPSKELNPSFWRKIKNWLSNW